MRARERDFCPAARECVIASELAQCSACWRTKREREKAKEETSRARAQELMSFERDHMALVLISHGRRETVSEISSQTTGGNLIQDARPEGRQQSTR